MSDDDSSPKALGATWPDQLTEEQRQDIWREHDACTDGLSHYDDHLHKIRSWNITLTTILVAGYFGINIQSPGHIKPGIAILAIALSSCLFWLLDGLTKSLQNVYINSSRNLEAILRHEHAPYFGPMTGLAFEKKQERHLVPTLKNLGDQSIWPFYVFPVLVSFLVVTAQSQARCGSIWSCTLSNDWVYGLAGLGALPIMLLMSHFAEDRQRRPKLSDGKGRRYRLARRALKREVAKALEQAGRELKCTYSLRKRHIFPFSIDFACEGLLIFVDSERVATNARYRDLRTTLLNSAGFSVLSISRSGEKFDSTDPNQNEGLHRSVVDSIEKYLGGSETEPEHGRDPAVRPPRQDAPLPVSPIS